MTTNVGHETRDANLRGVLLVTVGVMALVAVTSAAMVVLERRLGAREARLSPPASPLAETYGLREPPVPRLQTHPLRDLMDLRAREEALLHGYGWVDRQRGRVRIPIERAIDLMAARGLRGRPGGAG